MHPLMFGMWRMWRQSSCSASGCGPSPGGRGEHSGAGEGDGSGAFGVRRPLRFLAHKLQLSDEQIAELATILNDLKTERAQADVDERRTTSAFADVLAGEAVDEIRLTEAGAQRVRSAERLRDAVLVALRRMHGLLEPRQRAQLAYLIRSGALTI